MIGGVVSSLLGGAATKKAAQRLHDYARAELIKDGERLRALEPPVEKYDRSERKDFWNDPDRWEGIEDPRTTMIWEVRRRDVIDVRPETVEIHNPYLSGANQHPYASYMLYHYQQSSLLNQQPHPSGLSGLLRF